MAPQSSSACPNSHNTLYIKKERGEDLELLDGFPKGVRIDVRKVVKSCEIFVK